MIKFEYLINDNIVPFIVFLKEIPHWIKVENQKNILHSPTIFIIFISFFVLVLLKSSRIAKVIYGDSC